MGAHENRLAEAILMSTHNIGFNEEISKIISELSSNRQFICSSDLATFIIPPQTVFVGGYTVFTFSVLPTVCVCVCVRNVLFP